MHRRIRLKNDTSFLFNPLTPYILNLIISTDLLLCQYRPSYPNAVVPTYAEDVGPIKLPEFLYFIRNWPSLCPVNYFIIHLIKCFSTDWKRTRLYLSKCRLVFILSFEHGKNAEKQQLYVQRSMLELNEWSPLM